MRIIFRLLSCLCVSMAASVFLCWDALAGIGRAWLLDEYSYAYFVPPLALWIALHRLSRRPVPLRPSRGGVALLIPALGFWAVGQMSGIPTMPQYAVLGLFYGLVLACLGGRAVRVIWPALAYLFFAIPLPQAMYLGLSAKMQLVSSGVGASLLQVAGIPVFQDGNILDLGIYKLEVVEACNGLRYLFPLMGFGFLVALFLESSVWKRGVVFLSALPLAIGLNAARIAVIGLAASWGSTELAVDMTHAIGGWVAFFVCVAILFGEAALLARVPPRGRLAAAYLDWPSGPFGAPPLQTASRAPLVATVALFLCMAGLHAAGAFSPKPAVIPMRESFLSFPMRIDGWTGVREPMDPEAVTLLKATDILNATYAKPSEGAKTTDTINLFVAYYDSQRDERTFHSPTICLPGSGWTEKDPAIVHIPPGKAGPAGLSANRLIIEKGSQRQLVYYWYEQRGEAEPDFSRVKGRIIRDSLLTGRTDGALVRLVTTINPSETMDEAEARIWRFLNLSSAILNRYIPDISLYADRHKLS